MLLRTFSATLSALTMLACVAPTSQLGKISPEVIKAEQLKQQKLVITSSLAEQRRLENIAYPMLRMATPLCGKWVTTRSGLTVLNIHAWTRDYQEAAHALGFSDTLSVIGVVTGSSAQRSGFLVGDKLVWIAGKNAPIGRTATLEFSKCVTPPIKTRGVLPLASEPLNIDVSRQAAESPTFSQVQLAMPPDTVCAYGSMVVKDDMLNAWADGQQIVVTTAMIRFTGTDDGLAVVVAHEIAHNAMRHIDAKKKNATEGALFFAILDIAAATQGINSGGDFTNSGAAIGAMTYSQDCEREADYIGMYILARSGRTFTEAPNFWRRMAQESPGSIKYASSHPTTAERFVRLEQAAEEIKRKQAVDEALLPAKAHAGSRPSRRARAPSAVSAPPLPTTHR